MWQNTPSVFIGRHQNPWMECNLPFLNRLNIPFIRRESGGGTVYHDLGNLNFSFMAFNDVYNKIKNFELILQSLRVLDIDAAVSKRNDIHYRGRKFSGSAFRFEKEKSLHHGTLLVNADLNNLVNSLKVSPLGINSKGTASVISKVINLSEVNDKLRIKDIENVLSNLYLKSWDMPGGIIQFDDDIEFDNFFNHYLGVISGWEWKYGKTPFFTINLKGQSIKLDVKYGKILSIKAEIIEDGAADLTSILSGCPFTEKEISIRCNGAKNLALEQIRHELEKEYWR